MESPAQWLEKALVDLCQKIETGLGLGLDKEIINGLVSYCELADPRDAKEYLDVCSLFLSLIFCQFSTDSCLIVLWIIWSCILNEFFDFFINLTMALNLRSTSVSNLLVFRVEQL